MSSSGKKEVKRSLSLLEDYVRQVALWTVSLPDEDYEDLRVSGLWPVFQRELVDLVTRLLKSAGVPALVVAVAEVGMKRLSRTGRPMPHLHMGLAGWGERDHTGQWLLRPEVMDRLVLAACRKAGLPDRDRSTGSRIERVKKSISSYLAPYLAKGCDASDVDTSDGWEALVPHQWWNRSREAKALRDGHLWKLPPAFAAFVEQQRRRLESLGLGMGRMVCIGRRLSKTCDRTIEVLCFRWASVAALQEGLEWFAVWLSDPLAFEREADRCPSLRTLACDGAGVGSQPAQEAPCASSAVVPFPGAARPVPAGCLAA